MFAELLQKVGKDMKIEVALRNLQNQDVQFYLGDDTIVEMTVQGVGRYVILGTNDDGGEVIISTDKVSGCALLPKPQVSPGEDRERSTGEVLGTLGAVPPEALGFEAPSIADSSLEAELEKAGKEPQLDEGTEEGSDNASL